MLIVPLRRGDDTTGHLNLLDRRDGGAYGGDQVLALGPEAMDA